MKTAVQQMIDDLKAEGYDVTKLSIIEKYLKMEREQIKLAWENGALPDIMKEYKNSRTYYSKTYGK